MEYDIIIIGGSFIGVSTAIILAKSGFKIALVEKLPSVITNTKDDTLKNNKASRLLALSMQSCQNLQQNGLLHTISDNAQAIKQIRILEHKSHNIVDFFPDNIELSEFGYMIDEKKLISLIYQDLDTYSDNITLFRGYRLEEIIFENEKIIDKKKITAIIGTDNHDINYEQKSISAKLIIGADGKNSEVRKKSGIEVKLLDYKQVALVCDISHSVNHHGIAVEKFMPNGPFAILPKKGGYSSSIVWTEKAKIQSLIKELKPSLILSLIKERIGDHLGEIKMKSEINAFPLQLTHSKYYTSSSRRIVLIGDACHSIHPIAGQGVNLGFRDVESLTNLLIKQHSLGLDYGSTILLQEYSELRKKDIELMIYFTTIINSCFLDNSLFLKIGRQLAMKVLNNSNHYKNLFMRYASGFTSELV